MVVAVTFMTLASVFGQTNDINVLQVKANAGDAKAQYELGRCYDKGKGVKKDITEAFKWYRKSAEQENADAQRAVGWCYKDGEGVAKNAEEAVKWFRKAAEQGNAKAQIVLGSCFNKGEGVKKDASEAAKWFGEAVNGFRKAAEQGDAEAQFYLSGCYYNGDGVERNEVEALKWCRKSAEQGNDDAQYNLGWCYDTGEGVEKNAEEAFKWYRKAAEQGNADAQYNLGWCYDTGKGVEKNAEEAVKWFHKAAEQGNARAQFAIGLCYEHGHGIAKSATEANKWFHKAAEQDVFWSCIVRWNLKRIEISFWFLCLAIVSLCSAFSIRLWIIYSSYSKKRWFTPSLVTFFATLSVISACIIVSWSLDMISIQASIVGKWFREFSTGPLVMLSFALIALLISIGKSIQTHKELQKKEIVRTYAQYVKVGLINLGGMAIITLAVGRLTGLTVPGQPKTIIALILLALVVCGLMCIPTKKRYAKILGGETKGSKASQPSASLCLCVENSDGETR